MSVRLSLSFIFNKISRLTFFDDDIVAIVTGDLSEPAVHSMFNS